jgi:hypothetical protein
MPEHKNLIAQSLKLARHTEKISHHIGIGDGEASVLRAASETIQQLIDALQTATSTIEWCNRDIRDGALGMPISEARARQIAEVVPGVKVLTRTVSEWAVATAPAAPTSPRKAADE